MRRLPHGTRPEGQLYGRSMLAQVQVSLHFGLTPKDLVELGIDVPSLAQPERMVPASFVYAHLERVHRRGNFEAFAVALAEAHTLAAMGPVGFSLKAAGTVREALHCLERYQTLAQTVAHFEVVEEPPLAYWRERRHGPLCLGNLLATEVTVLITCTAARSLVPSFVPSWAQLRRPDAPLDRYRAFLGCPVETGHPIGQVAFAASYLELEPPHGDPELHAYLTQLLEAQRRTQSARPGIAEEIRRALPPRLSQGQAELGDVAKALKVSVRTLQRRLAEEGLNYSGILDELRHELALGYLRDPALSAAEVAYLLGYEEPTSFFRAFRRWTGQTPEVYRSGAASK